MEAKTAALAVVKQDVRLQEWSAQIEAQQASGLTVRQWCIENGVKPKTYYYHLKKVREQFLDSSPTIVPLNPCRVFLKVHCHTGVYCALCLM